MNVLFDVIAQALAFFYSIIPNYAVAIILLTILVMAFTTPLTLKSTRSMMMMQQLQPEMKKIQAKYKDDRQKQNEELLKFYKENNINPLGGCVPLLVQMPVFFFLYAVLRGLTRRVSDMGYPIGFVEGQSAAGVGLSQPPPLLSDFDPAYLHPDSQLYQSLSQTNTMTAFGLDLSESLSQAWSQGIVHSLPYIFLIAIVGFTSFYQQRQIQGRNPSANVNPQQQTLMKIMPIFLPLISINLPAGLVLYFAVSNLWRVGLQAFISRSIYGIKRGQPAPGKGGGKGGDTGGDKGGDKKPSGGKGSGGAAKELVKAGSTKSDKPKTNGSNGAGRAAPDRKQPAKASSRGSSPKKNASTPKSSGGAGSATPPNPTLQPRARKTKKR